MHAFALSHRLVSKALAGPGVGRPMPRVQRTGVSVRKVRSTASKRAPIELAWSGTCRSNHSRPRASEKVTFGSEDALSSSDAYFAAPKAQRAVAAIRR